MDPRIRTNNLSSQQCALKPLNQMVTSFFLLIFNDLNKYLLPEIKANPLKIKYIYFMCTLKMPNTLLREGAAIPFLFLFFFEKFPLAIWPFQWTSQNKSKCNRIKTINFNFVNQESN